MGADPSFSNESSRVCRVYRLGLIEYTKAWNLQNQLAEKIAAGDHPPALLLLEHPHVFTFGRRGSSENLLWNEAEMNRRMVDTHWVDRGGDVTYHGPGQLVGYPLLPLGNAPAGQENAGTFHLPQVDYTGYLRNLEKMLIMTLASFGVVGGQIAGRTGVWVQPDVLSRCRHCPPEFYRSPAKIASIGVKVDARGISRHGFALNVDANLEYFDGIIACGLDNQNKVNLSQLQAKTLGMDRIAESVVDHFGKVFDYRMQAHSGTILL